MSLREKLGPNLNNQFITDAGGGMNSGFNYKVEDSDKWRGMIGYNPSTSGIRGLRKFDPLYSYSPSEYPERPQRASASMVFPQQSTLSSNLQLGGFSNPLEPTRPSAFTGSPQQYTGVLPSAPVPPSNLFSTVPAFPSSANIAAPSLSRAQPTDYISGAAAQTGRINIPVSQGTLQATPEQALAFNAPRTPDTASSRTPEQQQALIAQMRERGSALGKQFAQDQESFFTAKRSENKLINDLVGEAILSGMPERQAKSMVRPYYDSQPSTFGGIKSDFENYKNIGFNKMSEFVQNNIRGMFPSSGSQRSSQIASITDTNSSANSPISTRKDRPIPLPVETGRPVPMPVETNFPWDNLNYAQLSRSPMSRIPNFSRF